MKIKYPRYFILLSHRNDLNNCRYYYWIYASPKHDYVTEFFKDNTKGVFTGYSLMQINDFLRNKDWLEITEEEAVLCH